MLYDYPAATAETVAAETDDAIREADELVAAAAASLDAPALEATLAPLELAMARTVRAYGRGGFLGQAHPDPAVRDAGTAADERLNTWRTRLPFRRDVFEAVSAFAATDEARRLDGEDALLLEHWQRDLRRAGHELDAAQRDELERLSTRLVELQVAFQRELNEYVDAIEVSREELAGLPEAYVERLEPGAAPGTFRVTLDYPLLNPFLERAEVRARREELFLKSWRKGGEPNRERLEEALRVRARIAELFGRPTWAHHAIEVKMAGTPERVRAFYEELLPAIRAAAERDRSALAERLEADGQPGPLQAWDWRFYDERTRQDRFGVDQGAVAEHIPLESALDGLFAITGEVFGLDYLPLPDAPVWHPSVRAYEIRDRMSGEPIAAFYADLFPREGKYGHAAAFQLELGHRGPDGARVPPVSAILANFTPPGGGRPSLLRHVELKTLFHEFGHILHMSLSRTAWARFSGANTEWDFVEAPSQILEHWIWDADVLARFARHWETGEPIPRAWVDQLVAARNLDVGIFYAVQAFYGAVNLAIHGAGAPPDLEAAQREAFAVTGMPYPEGTSFLSGFGHLMGGYDAGYYGYLWANVIGDDLFSRFAAEGILSPAVGADFRREVLEPNGGRPADALVHGFLGRAHTPEAFLALRGLRDAARTG